MKNTETAAIALLEATPAILSAIIAPLPDDLVSAPLDRGWSVKQMLAHFVDVERMGFHERLHRMVDEDNPTIVTVDVMARMDASGWEEWLVPQMLEEFACQRGEIVAWLRTLSDAQLARTAMHDTAGEMTVSNILHYWPTHDMAHIRQIQRMIGAVLSHEMGNAKEFDV